MKPVDQTKFGKDQGNCIAACIASILECPIQDIPDLWDAYKDGKNWLLTLNGWLRDNHSLAYFTANPHQGSGFISWWFPPDTYYVANGPSPRHEVQSGHAVVACNGKIVHDPHPSRAGLLAVEDYGFFLR